MVVDRTPQKIPQKSESIQMRPKSNKMIKNSTKPFEGSEFNLITETSFAGPFFQFRVAKKIPSAKIQNLLGLVRNH